MSKMEVSQKDEEMVEEWCQKLKSVHPTRAEMNMLVMDYLEKGQAHWRTMNGFTLVKFISFVNLFISKNTTV